MTDSVRMPDPETFRERIIGNVEEKIKDNPEKWPTILFICEMLDYLEQVKSELEENPRPYCNDKIPAAYHSDDWEKIVIILSDYHGNNRLLDADGAYNSGKKLCRRFRATEKLISDSIHRDYYINLDKSDEIRKFCQGLWENRSYVRDIHYILITDYSCSPESIQELQKRSGTRKKDANYRTRFDVWSIEQVYDNERKLNASVEDLEINLIEKFGEGIPCIKVNFDGDDTGYDSYLGYMKGSLLAKLYKEYNTRLLEGNIRVYLQGTPANKGILRTLNSADSHEKKRFFAYNNGLSATATSVEVSTSDASGSLIIDKIKGFQIVNGGQTTASIFKAWDHHNKNIDGVYVQIKLTIPTSESDDRGEMHRKIAEYSNTQNQIKKADFSSNSRFQIALERLSQSIIIPGQEFGWFYERTRGQYNVKLDLYSAKTKTEQKKEIPFDVRYPKSRKLNKTDVAIHYNTWRGLPHYAARGGEKNFQKYLSVIREEHISLSPEPEEKDRRYFRELIAMSILFIRTDALVYEWTQGTGSYGTSKYGAKMKREIVVYVLALLSYITKDSLNLEKVWGYQTTHGKSKNTIRVQKELEDFIMQLVPFVEDRVRTASDPREYARSADAWLRIKEDVDNSPIPVPDDVRENLCLSEEEMEDRENWLNSIKVFDEEEDESDGGEDNPDDVSTDPQKEEAEYGNPVEEKAPSDTPQGTETEPVVPSPINPEDLRKSLSNGSVMELSKFISNLQKEGVADDKLMTLLKRILAARRARKIPEKTLLDDAVEALLNTKKQNDKTSEEEKTDSSLPEPQTEPAVPENSGTSESGSAGPVFEYATKGAFGKMSPGKDGTYVLLKGSTVSLMDTGSFVEKQRMRRDDLLQKSVLIRNPDNVTATLTENLIMKTASEAATFVAARNTNGLDAWKCNGKPLKDYPELK